MDRIPVRVLRALILNLGSRTGYLHSLNVEIVFQTSTRPLPLESFIIRHFLTDLQFGATKSQQLHESYTRPDWRRYKKLHWTETIYLMFTTSYRITSSKKLFSEKGHFIYQDSQLPRLSTIICRRQTEFMLISSQSTNTLPRAI